MRQRLLNLARQRGEDFNFLLATYGLERLLYRLGQSPHRRDFVLKGAMLFRAWSGATYRPTRDLDLLGRGDPAIPRLVRLFEEIWQNPVQADGLELEPGSVRGEDIREAQEYGGIRIRMVARLGSARISLQVDIGFGDAITPCAAEITFPVLLDAPPPVLYAYPPETVVAEKLHAMIALGVANTRMKDFYDVWMIARRFAFDGSQLAEAIAATFERRRTPLPDGVPVALTDPFAGDEARQRQWGAFLGRIGQQDGSPTFPELADALARFLVPPLQSLQTEHAFGARWPAGGPWIGAD
ncbi:MAG TPA: nucleotidyl transferase AbiEii/AbiGii toxin family protein [Longimicrobium sp.]|nr:nucleotidyl transferase AbiEii/AbiGii toxin family protein [Longimicrobium sp.]